MEIILLEKIPNVGNFGDQVRVKSGYARNYLLPRKKALLATKYNLAEFTKQKAELEARAAKVIESAQGVANALTGKEITLVVQTGPQGKLYGSVSVPDVVEAIQKLGIKVDKKHVRLSQGIIRQTGDYEVVVRLHETVSQKIPLHVKASEDSAAEEAKK